MTDGNGIILAPLDRFAGTVADFRDILEGFHDETSDSEFPERWPFPHDTRRDDITPLPEDFLMLGEVHFIEGGIAFRHVMFDLDGERHERLAVYGRRLTKSYERNGHEYVRVDPFGPEGWRAAGEAVRRMYAHGIGVPYYSTAGARGMDVVVLTRIAPGTFDWTSIKEPPHDLCEGVEGGDDMIDGSYRGR